MLTPETLDALNTAVQAVIKEAGHDPRYADLVHALTAVHEAIPAHAADHAEPEGSPAEEAAESPAEEAAEQDAGTERDPHDPHGFMAARAKMTAARKGAK